MCDTCDTASLQIADAVIDPRLPVLVGPPVESSRIDGIDPSMDN